MEAEGGACGGCPPSLRLLDRVWRASRFGELPVTTQPIAASTLSSLSEVVKNAESAYGSTGKTTALVVPTDRADALKRRAAIRRGGARRIAPSISSRCGDVTGGNGEKAPAGAKPQAGSS